MKLLSGVIFVGILTNLVSSDLRSLVQSNNEFALKLYKTFPPSENTFYSPVSIFIALGMLYRGARGVTAKEMQQALSYDPQDAEGEFIHQEFAVLLREFVNPVDEYTFEIANAIVSSSSYQISEEYKEAINIYYRAVSKEVNFRTEKEKALEEINSWIQQKTKGKIPKLLDDLEDNTVVVLLNAVYFKGTWKTEFNVGNTRDDIFYAGGINPRKVKMMNEDNKFYYQLFRKEGFHCLKMPYKGERISMVVILPLERSGLRDLEDGLSSDRLKEIISVLKERKVKVSIPKFKVEDSRKLNESLKQLGMREAFQEGRADFRGIDASRRMYVSNVIHKAVVEINEEGSEAAAGTAVIGNSRIASSYPEFRVDRPFLFLIWDDSLEMILFMGRINEI